MEAAIGIITTIGTIVGFGVLQLLLIVVVELQLRKRRRLTPFDKQGKA